MGTDQNYIETLPPGSSLLWYEIIKVLGKGGFGITYLGKDTNLDQLVAIKEYLPTGFAVRAQGSEIRPSSPANAEKYTWGLDRFLKEAQTLARFRHPSIVRVLSFFRSGNTAYMVMEYEEGEGLEAVLKRRKTLPEKELKTILAPLLNGLETLHGNEFIHRDLKPANIIIRKSGLPVILDFGSARQSIAGQDNQFTSLLSMGYSPFEQYDSSGSNQGPWTDIYAMGGVLYRCITGEKPVDAAIRIAAKIRGQPDPMKPASEVGKGRYSPGFLMAVDKALMVLETDRPQSIAAWRPMLMGLGDLEALSKPSASPDQAPEDGPQGQEEASPAPSAETATPAATPRASSAPKRSAWRSFISSLNDIGMPQQPKKGEARSSATPADAPPPPVTPLAKVASGDGPPVPSQKNPARKIIPGSPDEEFNPAAMAADTPETQLQVGENPEGRRPGDTWLEPMTSMEFVWIPGGAFWMGSPKGEDGRRADEGPLHKVYVDGFWMGKFPVTWGQWNRVMGDPKGIYRPDRKDYPVERVLWEDTQAFLRKFVRMIGANYTVRLPTEAEWERAARAGTPIAAYYFGDEPSLLQDHAWYAANSGGQTHPVGLKRPNPWGLYDILGNVWEWTEDWYSEDAYEKSGYKNPHGAATGEVRVRRGGSWRSNAATCRVAHRNRVAVQSNSNALGFRLIRCDS